MGQVLIATSEVLSVPGKVGGQVSDHAASVLWLGPLDWLLSGD